MTVDDLKEFYGVKTDTALAEIVGLTKGAISKWRSKGIHPNTQARLQIKTNGKVKANLEKRTA